MIGTVPNSLILSPIPKKIRKVKSYENRDASFPLSSGLLCVYIYIHIFVYIYIYIYTIHSSNPFYRTRQLWSSSEVSVGPVVPSSKSVVDMVDHQSDGPIYGSMLRMLVLNQAGSKGRSV